MSGPRGYWSEMKMAEKGLKVIIQSEAIFVTSITSSATVKSFPHPLW